MQHHGAENEIDTVRGQGGPRGVFLSELNIVDAQRACARMPIAQHGCRHIDGDDFRSREELTQRERVVPKATSQVHDARWHESGKLTPQPFAQCTPRSIVMRARAAADGGKHACMGAAYSVAHGGRGGTAAKIRRTGAAEGEGGGKAADGFMALTEE